MITHCDPAQLPEASADDPPAGHMLEAHCPSCAHVVDAVCPKCKTHLEPAGVSTDGAAASNLNRVEYYRRFVLLLQNARNTKFMLGCYLIATGDAFADGISMESYARTWSVTRATVSKQCVFICRYLGLPPSRYMRRAETKDSYRQSNTRPKKIK
jgi:hypothetical protein